MGAVNNSECLHRKHFHFSKLTTSVLSVLHSESHGFRLVVLPKLSINEPVQYLDGWPHGNNEASK